MSIPVFIILNEWTDYDGSTSSTVTDGRYFDSMDSAWEALNLVAESYGTRLNADETSFWIDGDNEHALTGIEFEEYYIQELVKG